MQRLGIGFRMKLNRRQRYFVLTSSGSIANARCSTDISSE
jgi:hypothetical protein